MAVFLHTIGYGVLGIILMLAGFWVVDLVIPVDFVREILEEKNKAVGALAAGIFIAIGIIVRAAVL